MKGTVDGAGEAKYATGLSRIVCALERQRRDGKFSLNKLHKTWLLIIDGVLLSWQVALKVLMVFHRLLKDAPTSTALYKLALSSVHEFRLPNFMDDSTNESMRFPTLAKRIAKLQWMSLLGLVIS